MLEIDGHKRYLPPPPSAVAPTNRADGGSGAGQRADDFHDWSIYRSNINAKFVDNALRNKNSKPSPYGEFKMDPATVSSVIHHQRADSKLAGRNARGHIPQTLEEANMLINFGLPRPNTSRSRHSSTGNSFAVIENASVDTALDNIYHRRHHAAACQHNGPRAHSVDNLPHHVLHVQNGHVRHHSGMSRVSHANSHMAGHVAGHMAGHHHHNHHHHRHNHDQRHRRVSRDSTETNFPSSAALLANMAPVHVRNGDIHSQHSFDQSSHVTETGNLRRPSSVAAPPGHYRSEHLVHDVTRPQPRNRYDDYEVYQQTNVSHAAEFPFNIGRMYKNDVFTRKMPSQHTGTLSYFDAFDDHGELPDPVLSQYPHIQLRDVTAENYYSEGILNCGGKRVERVLDSITFELRGGELLAILAPPGKCRDRAYDFNW